MQHQKIEIKNMHSYIKHREKKMIDYFNLLSGKKGPKGGENNNIAYHESGPMQTRSSITHLSLIYVHPF
jgi:hypothetical protein